MAIPDLFRYRRHKRIDDIDLHGVPVPGLRGDFLRRDLGDRIATVGLYTYYGRNLFLAWGYVGESHCRYTATSDADGNWEPEREGCPDVQILTDPTGLAIRGNGNRWSVHLPITTGEPPPTPYNAGSGSGAGRGCPVALRG